MSDEGCFRSSQATPTATGVNPLTWFSLASGITVPLRNHRLEKLESKVKLLDEDINGFAGRKYELEIKQTKQETTLKNLKNKLWEEFEISYVQAVEYRDREIDLKEAQKEAKHLKARLKAIGEVNSVFFSLLRANQ